MMQKLLQFSCIILISIIFQMKLIENVKMMDLAAENETCRVYKDLNGICTKPHDCSTLYDPYNHRKSLTDGSCYQDLVCCPPKEIVKNNTGQQKFVTIKGKKVPDLLDFHTCRVELLKYRNLTINPNHFAKAMLIGFLPTNKENCEKLDKLNAEKGAKNNLDLKYYNCVKKPDGTYEVAVVAAFYAILVERGDRPNMAAIGWTQPKGDITYNCGGSLITDRFIVTAAHCKFHDGVQPDTIRLGDRFLVTSEDDDIAQQHKIEKFIIHPDYRSIYNYHDIAMIKTVDRVIFDKFVVPSCIDDLDSERLGYFNDWTVAGYGETEDRVPSNVLLELKVNLVSNEKCNETYEHDSSVPMGIIDSQFCVESQWVGTNIPDTCFGDSGSPLQFKTSIEIFHDDYDQTYLTSVYQTSTVLGIVSFGLDCGFNVPSVYTKLAYYKQWMQSVIEQY